ncbi:MAG: hypothetical protein NT084_00320 [Bacteroidetes bacterium]|jgi:hypothetical protein|nr:hypothetical protein [Bacteroidota bacterium]
MKNYTIKRNREPLTEEDVKKGQDFDKFMKTYSATKPPFFKTTTFYMSVVAVGIVIAVGSYFLITNSDEQKKTETAFVQAPLNGIDIKDTVYLMDAASGGEFIYNTGTIIHVPEGGFLDSAGNVVKGNVEIHYREFHNTADIFLAGIPMTYDSAGTRFHFESAGMLEITAWQNGKPLKVNPSSPLKVAMASNTNDNKFNVYYLDTVKKNWDFIAKDKAVVVGFVADTTKKNVAVNNSPVLTPPLEITKADKKKHSFVIKFDAKEFPELASYEGVRFQVDEKKTPYNTEDKKVVWDDVAIVRNADGATYTVTYTHDVKTAIYITDVVVDAENYAAAKKIYDQKYAVYQEQLKKQQELNRKLEHETEISLMNADAKRIFVNDTTLRAALARRNRMFSGGNEKEDMVVREFLVMNFGIWNSDCPASLPEGKPMLVKLIDSRTKKALVCDHVILVEKGRNAIFTYYARDLAQFQFNKDAENLLWAVTSDGKLAVCSSEDLQKIAGRSEANLTMTVQSEDLKTAAQARAVLGI